jgi:hypothetical protein
VCEWCVCESGGRIERGQTAHSSLAYVSPLPVTRLGEKCMLGFGDCAGDDVRRRLARPALFRHDLSKLSGGRPGVRAGVCAGVRVGDFRGGVRDPTVAGGDAVSACAARGTCVFVFLHIHKSVVPAWQW